MKKLTKILVIILSMALILGAFVIAAAAADTAPEATTANVFDIYDNAGNKTDSKNNLTDALVACPDGGKIVVTGDYEHGPRDNGSSINLNGRAVTLDLAGHTLAFSYNANSSNAPIYQQIAVTGTNITITSSAKGAKLVSASSIFQTNDGKLVLDGTDKPFTCQAIDGWNNNEAKNG